MASPRGMLTCTRTAAVRAHEHNVCDISALSSALARKALSQTNVERLFKDLLVSIIVIAAFRLALQPLQMAKHLPMPVRYRAGFLWLQLALHW